MPPPSFLCQAATAVEPNSGPPHLAARARLDRLLHAARPERVACASSGGRGAAGDPVSRFRFRMLLDRMLHLAVSSRVAPVRASVADGGGRVVFAFSQSQPPFVNEIMRDEATSAGVCEALAAHWIETHSRGSSLWQERYHCSGALGLRPESLVSVKRLQSAGVARDAEQDDATEIWLVLNGVLPRPLHARRVPETLPALYCGSNLIEGTTGAEGTRRLLDVMLARRGEDALYKKVQLQGRYCGHTLAVHIDQGVSFFDPNFGDFRFDDHAAFRRWFSGEFWPRSCYGLELGLGQAFAVHEFKRVETA
ncbi:YopT-type cysteine protease domain-containing protein [Paludibacterium yongneupense]|uniref:YopT-type cysteine protease domain-containing protein n=1 Tax=Paludibacterium yongneupense TaxID=400061 RepID=UPI0006852C3C|nr:YopT-type cysteine protease domain-containing protein [Paludibacterium yongneupense]